MLLTIITVSYNSEKTIAKTIESVLSQGLKDIQYIFIDGNSSDNTVALIQSYIHKFESNGIDFLILSEDDSGIYNAINKGLSLAKGKWISILNSDDCYESHVLQKEELLSISEGVIYGNMRIKKNNNILSPKKLDSIYNEMSLFHPSTFVHKNVYQQIGLYNESYSLASDYDFLLRCYISDINFHYINKVYTIYDTDGATGRNLIKSWNEVRIIKESNGRNKIL
ncbi:glycosyltransferase, partial [Vibrio parahaemolyticus]|nr:glycosyltransferase [Vibrio parahaemolyticus]